MRTFISTMVFLLLTLTLSAQVNDSEAYFSGSYDKKFIRKYKIKKVSIETFLNGKKSSRKYFYFNGLGLLNKQTIINSQGKKVGDYIFTYNRQGDQIEIKNIDYQLNKTYIATFEKIYKGLQLIREKSSELPFITEHNYNNKGQKIESVIFLSIDTAHAAKRILIYTYDVKERLISIKESFSKDNASEPQFRGTTLYTYDNDSNIVLVSRTNAATYHYSYNKGGMLKSKITKMPEDLGSMEIIEKYTYNFFSLPSLKETTFQGDVSASSILYKIDFGGRTRRRQFYTPKIN